MKAKRLCSITWIVSKILGLALLTGCQKSQIEQDKFLKQISYEEKIVTEISIGTEQKTHADTITRKYNAKKQLIIENDCIFYEYNEVGHFKQVFACLDANCEDVVRYEYTQQGNRQTIQQYRNDSLLKTQIVVTEGNQVLEKKHQSLISPHEPYLLWHHFTIQDGKRQKGQYHFRNPLKTDSLYIEQQYHYDSLGRLAQMIRVPQRDNYNTIQNRYFYNAQGQKIRSEHSSFMPLDRDFEKYLDHTKFYTYNTQNQLIEVKVISHKEDSEAVFSKTKYHYLK